MNLFKLLFSKITLLIGLSLMFFTLHAQAPSIQWETALGSNGKDVGWSVKQTSDGGYIVSGATQAESDDVHGFHGDQDAWLIKLDNQGDTIWTKCFGGGTTERAASVVQIYDGGYVFTGLTNSTDGDVSSSTHGSADFWIVRLDSAGTIIWDSIYGGGLMDNPHSICKSSDSGFVMGGFTASNDHDIAGGNHGDYDFWVVKVNKNGGMDWQKCYGGTDDERIRNIIHTKDNGYLAIGFSKSSDGDVSSNNGGFDYWLVKIDSLGNIQWENNFGGSNEDKAFMAIETNNNSFIISGYSGSSDGDVLNNIGGRDYWIIEVDSAGNLIRQINLGGTGLDEGYAVTNSFDNSGYVISGKTQSNDGDVLLNHGSEDIWVVKISPRDSDFKIDWQKSLGGTNADGESFQIITTNDSAYVLTGRASSTDWDVSSNNGNYDTWTVKLKDPTVNVQTKFADEISIYPNPAKSFLNIDLSEIDLMDELNLLVYNIYGQKVLETELDKQHNRINLDVYNTGVYLFVVKNNESIILSRKVIIAE